MKRIFLAAAVVAAVAGPVSAADLIADVPIVEVDEAMFDWTGLYIGAQGSMAWGTVRADEAYCVIVDMCNDTPGTRYFSEPDISGWGLGAHIGYNHQFDGFVLGAESDINWSGVEGTAGFTFHDGLDGEDYDGREGESTSFDLLWEGSTRVKVGVAVDRFMPYLTAGIAYGQAQLDTHRIYGEEEDEEDPYRELDFSHPLNLVGYTVGIGGAYAVTDDVILRAEARYTEYGETRSTDQVPDDGEQIIVTGPKLFSVQGGISFKF